jgi:hypothetical protein
MKRQRRVNPGFPERRYKARDARPAQISNASMEAAQLASCTAYRSLLGFVDAKRDEPWLVPFDFES